MHSICDTVLITSDEILRDLLRDRKIIRFGLTPPWVSAVLTCNGHEDQLKIVMNIE